LGDRLRAAVGRVMSRAYLRPPGARRYWPAAQPAGPGPGGRHRQPL